MSDPIVKALNPDAPGLSVAPEFEKTAGDAGFRPDHAPLAPSEVRVRIDQIDQQLLALLDQRANLAFQVAEAKKVEFHADPAQRPAVRPAREAQILRGLLSAPRQGARDLLVIRVWRELMAESIALQGGLDLHVWGGRDAARVAALSRARFGSAPAMTMRAKPEDALAAAKGPRGVGILALEPGQHWWARLLAEPALKIFAILPDLMSEGATAALAVGQVEPEPSGSDVTFFVTDSTASVSVIDEAFSRLGFAADLIATATNLKLFALSGYVQADDARLVSAPPEITGRLSGVIGAAPAAFDL